MEIHSFLMRIKKVCCLDSYLEWKFKIVERDESNTFNSLS